MDNWVRLEGFSKRHNHSDELSALPRAQPLGMLGTAASICILCNIFLCNKVHKLFAKNSSRRKYIKFKLIHKHLSRFRLSESPKWRFQPWQQGFFLLWPYGVKGLPMCSNTPSIMKQKITIYHSIRVWTKLVSLHALGRPGHNHKVLLLPF